MPIRLPRTDTIANIVDFGAVEGSLAAAATNATAFYAALSSGARRIAIPAGTWYLREILFESNVWLPQGVEIFGQGVNQTFIRYHPVNSAIPAFQFAPGVGWSVVRDLQLIGPVQPTINTPPQGVGISTEASHRNSVHDVSLWYFETGIQMNAGAPDTYSAHNVIERFDINACRTGIAIGPATNSNVIQGGRVFYSLVQYDATAPGGAREEGVGIDISGTIDPTHGPDGIQGLVISGVTIESNPIGLRVRAAREVFVSGCYFEPGPLAADPTYPRRRSLDVDADTVGLTFVSSIFSEPPVPAGEENWTPTYIAQPPEARSVIDALSAPTSGTFLGPGAYAVQGRGGGISGATAAHVNKLKNPDFSRGALFWSSVGQISVTPTTSTYVTGGASVLLAVVSNAAEHIYQDFVVDSGVRTVTVNVRYSLRSRDAHAFRFDLWDVASGTRLGFFSDTGPGPSEWRVRSLTGQFDGLSGGVVGPRELRVRVFPYAAPTGILGQQVYVDSVWLVEGEYAAPYRPYAEAVEVLADDDREIFFFGVTTVNVGPVAVMPSNVPSGAIAMVVELRISGANATTEGGTITVNDQQGSDPLTIVSATFDLRVTTTEVTIPLRSGVSPTWTVLGATTTNIINYRVRLKTWILRP